MGSNFFKFLFGRKDKKQSEETTTPEMDTKESDVQESANPKPEIQIPTRKVKCKRTFLLNVKTFTKKFGDAALKMEDEKGLPALAVLAQVALETGWGKKILKVKMMDGTTIDSKNLFNIKPGSRWEGKTGEAHVWEIENGKKVWKDEPFRVYDTYEDSFNDYADLILNTERYSAAVALKRDQDQYVVEIARAGYATDPKYAEKLQSIMRKNWEII